MTMTWLHNKTVNLMTEHHTIQKTDEFNNNDNELNCNLIIATHNVQSMTNHVKQNQIMQHMKLNNIDIL